MNFSKLGIALIVLLLAATSVILMRAESQPKPKQVARQTPQASGKETPNGTEELRSGFGLRPDMRPRTPQPEQQNEENERTVKLRAGATTVVSAGVPTRVTCEAKPSAGAGQMVPADSTVWVCDCEMAEGEDETVYLVRKLITTAGTVVHETVLERFVSEFTEEYKLTACLDMLKQTTMCK